MLTWNTIEWNRKRVYEFIMDFFFFIPITAAVIHSNTANFLLSWWWVGVPTVDLPSAAVLSQSQTIHFVFHHLSSTYPTVCLLVYCTFNASNNCQNPQKPLFLVPDLKMCPHAGLYASGGIIKVCYSEGRKNIQWLLVWHHKGYFGCL